MAEEKVTLEGLRKLLHDLQMLVKSPGWARQAELVDMQVDLRKNQIVSEPCKSLDDTLAQEYMKGEVSGMALFARMPFIEIEAVEQAIKELEEKSNG